MVLASNTADDALRGEVELAARGDEAAFTRIVAAHSDVLSRVCFVICGDQDLADEAVQAAWQTAWVKLAKLRDPDRLRPWLIAVASNEARGLIRRRRRRSISEVDLEQAGDRAGPGDPGDRARDLDLINVLARLSSDDRTLLALRYVAGFDSSEIARATGRSASGTRARLGRLLARLRSELRDG
jgi:RNA polymerase sigma factor (sigma-70 family)